MPKDFEPYDPGCTGHVHGVNPKIIEYEYIVITNSTGWERTLSERAFNKYIKKSWTVDWDENGVYAGLYYTYKQRIKK